MLDKYLYRKNNKKDLEVGKVRKIFWKVNLYVETFLYTLWTFSFSVVCIYLLSWFVLCRVFFFIVVGWSMMLMNDISWMHMKQVWLVMRMNNWIGLGGIMWHHHNNEKSYFNEKSHFFCFLLLLTVLCVCVCLLDMHKS